LKRKDRPPGIKSSYNYTRMRGGETVGALTPSQEFISGRGGKKKRGGRTGN